MIEPDTAPNGQDAQATPPEPQPGRRRRSWLRLPLTVLLQLLLLLLLVSLWVLGTQSGLRFTLALAEELAPGLVQVEQAEGRVLGDLHLRGVQLHVPGLDLDLGSLDLHWAPLAVLSGTLRVQELVARDLDLVVAPSEEPTEEGAEIELPSIVLPLGVELERLLVERVSIGQGGDSAPFRIDSAALSAALRGSALTLRELKLALPEPRFDAVAEGEGELTGDYGLDLNLTWELKQAPSLELGGRATIGGDLSRLTLKHDLSGSAEARLDAVVTAVLDAPRWEGTLQIDRVDLPDIQPDLPAVDLTGRFSTSGDLNDARVQGSLAGDAPDLPDFGRLNANLDLAWRAQVLDIGVLELTEQKSGALLSANGRVDLSEAVGSFDVEAAWENLRWPLTGVSVAEVRQGKLDSSGTFEVFDYKLSAQAWGRDFPEASLQMVGDGDLEGAQVRSLTLDVLGGRVEAQGSVAWVPDLTWDLQLSADGIDTGGQWPEMPAKLEFTLTSSGGLEAFGYELDAELDSVAAAIPSATLQLNGEGDVRGVRLAGLRVQTLGGLIEARGEAGWDPAVRWDAGLEWKDIDPGTQWPEWKGRLKGRLESTGHLEEDGPDLIALIDGLRGELRGYPVRANGKASMQGGAIGIQELLIASGPSELRVDGNVGDALDLTFDLNSPNLGTLLPEASGSVRAKGTVSGTIEAPAVKLDLAADSVDVAGQGIDRLRGKVDLNLARGGPLVVDLSGERLVAGGLVFDLLRIEGKGDTGAHRLSAKVEGEVLALELNAAGGLREGNAYAGELGGLTIRSRDFGSWRLQKAAPLSLSGARVSAGPVCIRDEGGSGGCARFEQSEAANWTAALDLDKLDFELLAPFIPDGLLLEGQIGAKADFKAAGGVLTGRADLQVPRGVLSADREADVQVLDFSSARIRVDAGGRGVDANLDFPLAGLGGMDGDVSLPGWRLDDPARPDQSMRGRVKFAVRDLALVSRLVPDVTDVTGGIDVDLRLSGSIGRPGVQGYARLAGGGFQVPFIGLKVDQLTFDAEAKALERIEYSGGFSAGDGRLEIMGESLFGGAGMVTRITASGKNLKLADSSEFFLLASPELSVEAGPEGASLSGEVDVPKARIRPRSIPAGTVSPSPDVVMLADVEREPAFPVTLDLRLVLGKEVSIQAFGLRGRLEGDLLVLQTPGRELLGDGDLAIIDGTYRLSSGIKLTAAIGKPLKIEQGLLVFAKTPLSNPALVLTAKREGGDVTAGVRVFGTIKNPKLTFFSDSDPALSQSEVSSYLLTGVPPKGAAGDAGDRSLSVGTYVAPKLFVEYDYSLGDEADKVKLRYDLNNWVELQTETGDDQGADIFFKFER